MPQIKELIEDFSKGEKDFDKVIPTGIVCLDEVIGGLHLGFIHTIAGRPCMGTSTFAATLLRNIGVYGNTPSAMLVSEYGVYNALKRLYSTECGCCSNDDFNRMLAEGDDLEVGSAKRLCEAQEKLKEIGFYPKGKNRLFWEQMRKAPVWIEPMESKNVDLLVAQLERLKNDCGVKLVIIDKLDFLTPAAGYNGNHTYMSKLHCAVQRLDIALLITAGLSYTLEYRGGTMRPRLSDLHGGYYHETVSSVGMFLYRPEYYRIYEDEEGSTLEKTELIVAKNNYGPIDNIRLAFRGYSSFEELKEPNVVGV